MPDPKSKITEANRLVPLSEVLQIVDAFVAAPDGYYYARQHERIQGWEAGNRRVREEIEKHFASDEDDD